MRQRMYMKNIKICNHSYLLHMLNLCYFAIKNNYMPKLEMIKTLNVRNMSLFVWQNLICITRNMADIKQAKLRSTKCIWRPYFWNVSTWYIYTYSAFTCGWYSLFNRYLASNKLKSNFRYDSIIYSWTVIGNVFTADT